MKVLALIKRIMQQFIYDKRSLALLFIAPLFALTLLWLVLDMEQYKPTMVVTDVPDSFISVLETQDITIKNVNRERAKTTLQSNEADAWLYWEDQQPILVMEGSNPNATKAVQIEMEKATKQMNTQGTNVTIKFLHGSKDLGLFDNAGPPLIGLFVFFFVFLLSGVTFLRERTQGTLERLLATPLKRWEIVVGYLGGFGIFVVFQSVLIVLYSIYVLGMYMEGTILPVLIVTFVLSLCAQSLGTFLSAYAKNEFQMIQFIPVIIVPQVFFSGVFPTEQVAWINMIAKAMPLTYGSEAMREIMLRGQGLSMEVVTDILVLIGFSLLFILLNIIALKKHRKI